MKWINYVLSFQRAVFGYKNTGVVCFDGVVDYSGVEQSSRVGTGRLQDVVSREQRGWLTATSLDPTEFYLTRDCNQQEMMTMETKTFKMKIGAPTNGEQVYLEGEGVLIGDPVDVIAHALPVYRQKDYPTYQARKNGPYCVSLAASGLRISATSEKLVFAKLEDAAAFGEEIHSLFALLGFPVRETDPRKQLEFAKEHKDEMYVPLQEIAKRHNGSFVEPK